MESAVGGIHPRVCGRAARASSARLCRCVPASASTRGSAARAPASPRKRPARVRGIGRFCIVDARRTVGIASAGYRRSDNRNKAPNPCEQAARRFSHPALFLRQQTAPYTHRSLACAFSSKSEGDGKLIRQVDTAHAAKERIECLEPALLRNAMRTAPGSFTSISGGSSSRMRARSDAVSCSQISRLGARGVFRVNSVGFAGRYEAIVPRSVAHRASRADRVRRAVSQAQRYCYAHCGLARRVERRKPGESNAIPKRYALGSNQARSLDQFSFHGRQRWSRTTAALRPPVLEAGGDSNVSFILLGAGSGEPCRLLPPRDYVRARNGRHCSGASSNSMRGGVRGSWAGFRG